MTKKNSFEQDLTDLADHVARLEQGDLSLEESLKQFEQGIKLVKRCHMTLKQAEQKVQVLLEKSDGTTELTSYAGKTDDNED